MRCPSWRRAGQRQSLVPPVLPMGRNRPPLPKHIPKFPRGTHLGVPAGAAGAVGAAGACHLQGAIAVELPRGRGAPQVLSPSLGAAQLLPGRRGGGR